MGIDIYAKWDRMTPQQDAAQITGYSVEHGFVGYLREAYHGEPYATKVLVPEAFKYGRARIDAGTLQKRLPDTLHVAETRERHVYGATDAEQRAAARAFADYIQGPFLEVDGEALGGIADYRVESPQFAFTVPDPNILFVGPGSGTSVSDGYWAMIGPLSKGKHTLHFGGGFVGTPFGDFALDMTYKVTVK